MREGHSEEGSSRACDLVSNWNFENDAMLNDVAGVSFCFAKRVSTAPPCEEKEYAEKLINFGIMHYW
jgi:hypothetical protein